MVQKEDKVKIEKKINEKQKQCCVKDCVNEVTNRSRFSLRCLSEDDFKDDYIECNWNKVCHYHYFHDLYNYKKKINGSTTKPLKKIQKNNHHSRKKGVNIEVYTSELDLFQNFVQNVNQYDIN
jgi:hypothetical protein